MTNRYNPAAPAADDTRPLAILVGNGAGCHECGRTSVGVAKVGRNTAGHCAHHAEIVKRVMRMQLGMDTYVTARTAR